MDEKPAAKEPARRHAEYDEWVREHPYGDQDENGIDLSLIRANLRLTPTERLVAAQQDADSLELMFNGTHRH